MKKSYNDVLSKEIALLEGVRSGKDITAKWLAQRDEVVALTRKLANEAWLAGPAERETTPS